MPQSGAKERLTMENSDVLVVLCLLSKYIRMNIHMLQATHNLSGNEITHLPGSHFACQGLQAHDSCLCKHVIMA